MLFIDMSLGISLSGLTVEIGLGIVELLKAAHKKTYIRKSEIKNLHFPIVGRSTMSLKLRGNYKHSFYAFSSIEFEGDFGSDPEVFMLFSTNDEPIKFNSNKHAINDENLKVVKLKRQFFQNNKYKYGIEKELHYYSNNETEYDIRPFIIVVFGDDSLGFATVTLINKSTGITKSNGVIEGIIPGTGTNYFQPQARKLVWPNGKDLLRRLREPQTGRSFRLDKEQVDNILSLKRYFISLLKPNISTVLKEKHITE